uniref:Uncharacterized protein n=1 Tax=Anopheles maculatus TaxID=74869 RepID=A0A182SX21_9DIPT
MSQCLDVATIHQPLDTQTYTEGIEVDQSSYNDRMQTIECKTQIDMHHVYATATRRQTSPIQVGPLDEAFESCVRGTHQLKIAPLKQVTKQESKPVPPAEKIQASAKKKKDVFITHYAERLYRTNAQPELAFREFASHQTISFRFDISFAPLVTGAISGIIIIAPVVMLPSTGRLPNGVRVSTNRSSLCHVIAIIGCTTFISAKV